MGHRKTYEVYEISQDGLLKTPQFSEGYGYYGSLYGTFDTEDEAIAAIVEKREEYRSFAVLPVIQYVEEQK